MQNMPDYSQIIRYAQSPEGKKLLTMLQKADSADLNRVVDAAKNGDYTAAHSALSGLLNNPEAQALLNQLGGSHGGNGR